MRAGVAERGFVGRLSRVRESPPVLLDVAHNPDAARTLVRYLEEEVVARGLRPVVLMGMMRDKDARGVLVLLARVADGLIVTRARVPDAVPAADLAALAREAGLACTVAATVEEGMEILAERLAAPGRVGLITGSFYVVGEAMDHMDAHPEWPGRRG